MLQQIKDQVGQAVNSLTGDLEGQLKKIEKQESVLIEQRPDWIEICQLCETENEYKIYGSNSNQDKLDFIGTFKEESDCCCRWGLHNARAFKAKFEIDGYNISNLEAPYKCHGCQPFVSCPFSEPLAMILKDNYKVGELNQICHGPVCGRNTCSILEVNVKDKTGNLTYMVSGKCCQKSILCLPFQCFGCPNIEYTIKDTSKQVVGKIVNVYNDCVQEVFSKADKFWVQFPQNAEPVRKLLLINLAIWLDYLQYNG